MKRLATALVICALAVTGAPLASAAGTPQGLRPVLLHDESIRSAHDSQGALPASPAAARDAAGATARPVPMGMHASGTLAPHAPISIRGDAQICDPVLGGLLSGVVNCDAADGSAERPYVISGWLIAGHGAAGTSTADPQDTDTHTSTLTIEETTRHIVVRGNVILGSPPAVSNLDHAAHEAFIVTSVSEAENLVIENNEVFGFRPLMLVRSPGTIVRGNVFTKTKGGFGVHSLSRGVIFEGNVVTSNEPLTGFTPGFEISGTDTVLRGNVVLGQNPSYAIGGGNLVDLPRGLAGFADDNRADGCTLVVIRGEHGTTFDGSDPTRCLLAVIDSSDVTLENLSLTTNTLAIWGSENVTVAGGLFASYDTGVVCCGPGIAEDATLWIMRSKHVSVSHARVTRGLNEAVAVTASTDVTFSHCEIAPEGGAVGVAIRLFEPLFSRDVTFSHGTLAGGRERAVLAVGDHSLTIEDNDMPAGPQLPAAGALLRPALEALGEDRLQFGGIWDFDSEGTRIAGNRILGERQEPPNWHAIMLVRGSRPVIEQNIVKHARGFGVRLYGSSDALVSGNAVLDARGSGIMVDGSERTTIVSNLIVSNDIGIRLTRSSKRLPLPSATINFNSIFGNCTGPAVDESCGAIPLTHGCETVPTRACVGLDVVAAVSPVDARFNFWGSDDGPSGIGPGHGDAIVSAGPEVLFEPWQNGQM